MRQQLRSPCRSDRAGDDLFDDPPLGPRKPVDGETNRLKVIRRVTRQVIAGEPEERAEQPPPPSAVQATTAQQLEGKHGQG